MRVFVLCNMNCSDLKGHGGRCGYCTNQPAIREQAPRLPSESLALVRMALEQKRHEAFFPHGKGGKQNSKEKLKSEKDMFLSTEECSLREQPWLTRH